MFFNSCVREKTGNWRKRVVAEPRAALPVAPLWRPWQQPPPQRRPPFVNQDHIIIQAAI